MEINPKYDLGEQVRFGPHIGYIIGLLLKPENTILYQISYWNEDKPVVDTFYDFEICKTVKMGFIKASSSIG